MKYFLSTKNFIANKLLEVISIAIVADDGREYYALNLDCNSITAELSTKINIIELLPDKTHPAWKTQYHIKLDLLYFIHGHKGYLWYSSEDVEGLKDDAWFDDDIAFWSCNSFRDWKCFCKIFGHSGIEYLVQCLPTRCNNIEQYALGIFKAPKKPKEAIYDALIDARWSQKTYNELKKTLNS